MRNIGRYLSLLLFLGIVSTSFTAHALVDCIRALEFSDKSKFIDKELTNNFANVRDKVLSFTANGKNIPFVLTTHEPATDNMRGDRLALALNMKAASPQEAINFYLAVLDLFLREDRVVTLTMRRKIDPSRSRRLDFSMGNFEVSAENGTEIYSRGEPEKMGTIYSSENIDLLSKEGKFLAPEEQALFEGLDIGKKDFLIKFFPHRGRGEVELSEQLFRAIVNFGTP